jgi:hypothetical protein
MRRDDVKVLSKILAEALVESLSPEELAWAIRNPMDSAVSAVQGVRRAYFLLGERK